MTDHLRELLEKATPGPWLSWFDGYAGASDEDGVPRFFVGVSPDDPEGVAHWITDPDAAFIAGWRNAAPLILDVLDAARAVLRQHDFEGPITGTEWQTLRDQLDALDAHLEASKPK